MVNIIGGNKKRTKLEVPINSVRPTSSQKKESIFSIIESYFTKKNKPAFVGKKILDLFAGSGSLGLEAISRGAQYCYFYEVNKSVISFLNKNCLKVCNNNQFNIIENDIINNKFDIINDKISIVFIDPPYNFSNYENILFNIYDSNFLNNESIVIIESHKNKVINYQKFFNKFDERKYGKTKISFLNLHY